MVIVCPEVKHTLKNGKVEKGFYMDGKLKENLDFEVARVKKNWDCIFIVDGEEGAAKSTLGSTIAYYLSQQFETKFDIDDIVYTNEQFMKWVDTQQFGLS